MPSHSSRPTPGAIALVGSGEYLDFMNTTDMYLLDTLGGASMARVALLPTASGLEPDGPTYWNELGLSHFKQLGVSDIRATRIIDRDSAASPEQLALLRDADFYYYSGGNPQHTIDTMHDSLAWEIIYSAYQHGAVLAGCSAGAMALGAYTISIRQMMSGGQPDLVPSLGVVPNVIVFPHFDRMSNFIDSATFQTLLSTLPEGIVVVGVDENTALVRIQAPSMDDPARWRVMGHQTVKIFERDADTKILHTGEEISL
jgi:cyanophycinase